MKNIYGKGYGMMKRLGYTRKVCGTREKGICVPIELHMKENNNGLGYCASKETNKPSFNINSYKRFFQANFNSDAS